MIKLCASGILRRATMSLPTKATPIEYFLWHGHPTASASPLLAPTVLYMYGMLPPARVSLHTLVTPPAASTPSPGRTIVAASLLPALIERYGSGTPPPGAKCLSLLNVPLQSML